MKNSTNINVFSSTHEPYWIASVEKIKYPMLEEDFETDIAIIGGGMVGVTAAYLLKKKGFKVALLEANRIAHGTSGHTTAKITAQHGLIYDKLINKFGEEKTKQYADANIYAIDFIENLVNEKNIDCDFSRRSSYIYTQSENYIDKIEKEVEAAKKLGIDALYKQKLALPFSIKGAIGFQNQAQFHPVKYLYGISKYIDGEGSYIFEGTKVVDIEEGEKCIVTTGTGNKIRASKVVIASHFPCYDGLGMYFARMHIMKSYLIGIKSKDKLPEGMYISAEEPMRSLRSTRYKDGEIILVGGEHHKTGSEKYTNIHYENLANFAKESFHVEDILYRWSTQDCITADEVPYVGHLTSRTKNIFVATGFRKWGMTNSTAAALIITDLITREESPWAQIYNPSRFDIIASGGKLISENLNVAEKFIVGKVAPIPDNIKINNGEAEIINVHGKRVGAYRDEHGKLHIVDITCTHLGCELVWNEAEETWDCPCHGSRFSYDGKNIEGPAFIPLNNIGEGPNHKDANVF